MEHLLRFLYGKSVPTRRQFVFLYPGMDANDKHQVDRLISLVRKVDIR